MIDFKELTELSVTRANRWHDGDFHHWTILEWAGAMCGEAGEAANVAKKLRRHEQQITGNKGASFEELRDKLGTECADVVLYMILLCAYYDINLENYIVDTFNEKSIEMGFPERYFRQ